MPFDFQNDPFGGKQGRRFKFLAFCSGIPREPIQVTVFVPAPRPGYIASIAVLFAGGRGFLPGATGNGTYERG